MKWKFRHVGDEKVYIFQNSTKVTSRIFVFAKLTSHTPASVQNYSRVQCTWVKWYVQYRVYVYILMLFFNAVAPADIFYLYMHEHMQSALLNSSSTSLLSCLVSVGFAFVLRWHPYFQWKEDVPFPSLPFPTVPTFHSKHKHTFTTVNTHSGWVNHSSSVHSAHRFTCFWWPVSVFNKQVVSKPSILAWSLHLWACEWGEPWQDRIVCRRGEEWLKDSSV